MDGYCVVGRQGENPGYLVVSDPELARACRQQTIRFADARPALDALAGLREMHLIAHEDLDALSGIVPSVKRMRERAAEKAKLGCGCCGRRVAGSPTAWLLLLAANGMGIAAVCRRCSGLPDVLDRAVRQMAAATGRAMWLPPLSRKAGRA